MAMTTKAPKPVSKRAVKHPVDAVVLGARVPVILAENVKKRAAKSDLTVSAFVLQAIETAMDDSILSAKVDDALAKVVRLQAHRMRLSIDDYVLKAIDQAADPLVLTYQANTDLADQIADLAKMSGINSDEFVNRAVLNEVSRLTTIKPEKPLTLAEIAKDLSTKLDQIASLTARAEATSRQSAAQIALMASALSIAPSAPNQGITTTSQAKQEASKVLARSPPTAEPYARNPVLGTSN